MRNFCKILFWILLWTPVLFAKEFLPKNCQALALTKNHLSLKADKQHIVFFHNLTEHDIWLAHLNKSALTQELSQNHWAAFYAPKEGAEFKCIQATSGHEQQVPCHQVVAVCINPIQAPHTEAAKYNQWLLDYATWFEAKAYLERMGWTFVAHK